MDGEAIREIKELTLETAACHDIGERTYSAVQQHEIVPTTFTPPTLDLFTLQGLVDYLDTNRDVIDPGNVIVHVEGPTSVCVVSGLHGVKPNRSHYARAEAELPHVRPFQEEWVTPEEMIIALNAMCVETSERARAVALVGNVADKASIRQEDDGFTQHVTTKAGVVTVNESEIKNPVTLAPYRSFRETEQVESPFILRFRKAHDGGAECGLFLADGYAWRLVAVQRIKDWLESKVGLEYSVIA